jgi:hypothetical protein
MLPSIATLLMFKVIIVGPLELYFVAPVPYICNIITGRNTAF